MTPRHFRFSSLSDLSHAISTREGGVSPAPFATLNLGYGVPDQEENVAANRRTFIRSLDLDPKQVVTARITHGNDVSVFRAADRDRGPAAKRPVRKGSDRTEMVFFTDGVVSDVPGLHFLLTFADCVPLLFVDTRRDVMGAAHAGWRGTARRMGPAVVAALQAHFGSDPGDIRVGIGPSIGPCCYRVGPEVTESFQVAGTVPVLTEGEDQIHLDLWASNEAQLRAVGVEQIENPRLCTACHTSMFFSHRAEQGRTGRFALCAGLAS